MSELTHFNNFIANRYTSIPYSTQWMVHIGWIPDIVSNRLKDVDTEVWNIEKTGGALIEQTDKTHQNIMQGNIFAQAVSVPGEKLNIDHVGVDNNYRGGFNQAPILNSRGNCEPITIDFLETRDSFADLVIRPWIIQVGFHGLVPPRRYSDGLKTVLTVYQFERGDITKPDLKPKARKIWSFFNAVPISIDPDTFDYQKNQITILKTQWLYTHYTVDAANDTRASNITKNVPPTFVTEKIQPSNVRDLSKSTNPLVTGKPNLGGSGSTFGANTPTFGGSLTDTATKPSTFGSF